jgi:hypothetical protein
MCIDRIDWTQIDYIIDDNGGMAETLVFPSGSSVPILN